MIFIFYIALYIFLCVGYTKNKKNKILLRTHTNFYFISIFILFIAFHLLAMLGSYIICLIIDLINGRGLPDFGTRMPSYHDFRILYRSMATSTGGLVVIVGGILIIVIALISTTFVFSYLKKFQKNIKIKLK